MRKSGTAINSRKIFYKRFWLCFILFFFISVVLFASIFFLTVRRQKAIFKVRQREQVFSERALLKSIVSNPSSDLEVIASSRLFNKVFFGSFVSPQMKLDFRQLCYQIFKTKKTYYQLRLLDTEGKEIFRIDRDQDTIMFRKENQLQNKKSRYYFEHTIKLDSGKIYVSPMDLNIEHEKIERPLRAMVRFCTPAFYQGKKRGIWVLNYDVSDLLRRSIKKSGPEKNFLLNQQGYFLVAPDSAMEWGFMFADRKKMLFKNFYPQSALRVDSMDQGQFVDKQGLWMTCIIYPLDRTEMDSNCVSDLTWWKLVNLTPSEEWQRVYWQKLGGLGVLFFPILIFGLWLSFFYARISRRRYEDQQILIHSEKLLRKSNDTKNKFFSILSHDLKNYSGSISSYLSLIRDNFKEFSPGDQLTHINDVTDAAIQMNKLLQDILEWARIQEGAHQFDPELIDVETMFVNLKKTYMLDLKRKKLCLRSEIEPGIQVFVDKNGLDTCLRNLLTNAIKFSFTENEICFSARRKAEQVELEIRDHGTGIREDEQKKLFDLGSRITHKGTGNEEGTGFGLKLVFELVHENQGNIRVQSEYGNGTTFLLTFPSGK